MKVNKYFAIGIFGAMAASAALVLKKRPKGERSMQKKDRSDVANVINDLKYCGGEGTHVADWLDTLLSNGETNMDNIISSLNELKFATDAALIKLQK